MPDDEKELEILLGTLDVLVLKTLSWGTMHGYGVARWIRESSGQTFRILDGALYTSLHRMEERGWIESEWGLSENNRRAKYYQLTTAGRAELKAQAQRWSRYAAAVTRVLKTA
jgi:transcriptional regulator